MASYDVTVTVRFHEVDRAGIVFFGRFFEYCHIAYEELVIEILGDMNRCFDEGWAMPLVHAESDYKRPLRLGDRIRVSLSVERLGTSSVTFAYTLYGPEDDLRAKAKLVHAFVDTQGFGSRTAPKEFVDGLRRLGLVD